MDWKGLHMIYTLEWSPETKKKDGNGQWMLGLLTKNAIFLMAPVPGWGSVTGWGSTPMVLSYFTTISLIWRDSCGNKIHVHVWDIISQQQCPTPNICGGAIPWGQLDQRISGPNLLSFLRRTMMQLCFCGRVKGWQVSHDKIQEDYTSVINWIQCRWWLMMPKYVSCFELDLTTDPRQGCTLSTSSFNASRWLASRASPAWHGGGSS